MSAQVEVTAVHHRYARQDGGWQPVLHDVSFTVRAGECLGIVGESGSGKSTLGRILLGLERPQRGGVRIDGQALYPPRRWLWRQPPWAGVSAVFQDYASSANPRMTVLQIVAEPLRVRGETRGEALRHRVAALLAQVGLEEGLGERFPHQLSGGQMQRVCIARALACQPRFLVLDEAVSALDMAVQVQILDLLHQLRQRLGLTYLFISHDLMAVAYLCQRVLFLQQGRIIERVEDIAGLGQVRHPYARRLLRTVMAL